MSNILKPNYIPKLITAFEWKLNHHQRWIDDITIRDVDFRKDINDLYKRINEMQAKENKRLINRLKNLFRKE